MKGLVGWTMIWVSVAAVGQARPPAAAAKPLRASVDRDKELHARALRAVEAERARAKQALCPKAVTTLEVNGCYAREVGLSDGNYVQLELALGALLRSGDEAAAKTPGGRIPFDEGETAWHTYREQACTAAGAQYEGGTMRPSVEMDCQVTLVRSHMNELWTIYSDLGMR